MTFSTKELFGGAITSELPIDWKDLSDVRPIPDNQECFQDSLVAENPKLLIVEILEFQEDVQDKDAALFFFNDLAERNDCMQDPNNISFAPANPPASPTALLQDESIVAGTNQVRVCAGFGYHKVAMGRDFDQMGNSRRATQKIKHIRVDLFVLRLPVQETDLLITMSSPTDDEDVSMEDSGATDEILSRVISNFKINEWGLFG
eukprot:CAMPEP_0116142338 /NCGR_PEP_ID=MMETSP0329-20121206/14857_1 /TAXON_ID=697910 /ORGANISM="Pseudo-nitzschia arenysensis, Strain B593" /LENGTH=203 /DNA_ID=CAMNT_0003637571 /DNA_START=180 /DNA_END=791 /DNA_ORIENTATION=-